MCLLGAAVWAVHCFRTWRSAASEAGREEDAGEEDG